jgi:Mg2+/Co2+ transporter CorB
MPIGIDDFLILGAIGLLTMVSAFLAACETAFSAASRPRMFELARRGLKRAQLVADLRERTEEVIGAILLGNNLVNIVISTLATSLLIAWFGEIGVAYATVALSILLIAFCEFLPKTFALRNADRVAISVAPMLAWVVRLLLPVARLFRLFSQAVLAPFKRRTRLERDAAEEEELRGAIELYAGADKGEEALHERAMLRGVLGLADVDIGRVMTHRGAMRTIDAGLPAASIVAEAVASPYSRLPLWRDEPDNIIGILRVKDILLALQARAGKVEAIDVEALALPPWFVPEKTDLLAQLQAFRRRREHFALVVDEYGELQGLVTLEDIVEEIVGHIASGRDVFMPGVRPQPGGSYLIDGGAAIRDLNREFGWALPEQDAATIAGLVLHEARRIPEIGQVFRFYGFRFETVRRRRNRVTAIKVTPPASGKAELPHHADNQALP